MRAHKTMVMLVVTAMAVVMGCGSGQVEPHFLPAARPWSEQPSPEEVAAFHRRRTAPLAAQLKAFSQRECQPAGGQQQLELARRYYLEALVHEANDLHHQISDTTQTQRQRMHLSADALQLAAGRWPTPLWGYDGPRISGRQCEGPFQPFPLAKAVAEAIVDPMLKSAKNPLLLFVVPFAALPAVPVALVDLLAFPTGAWWWMGEAKTTDMPLDEADATSWSAARSSWQRAWHDTDDERMLALRLHDLVGAGHRWSVGGELRDLRAVEGRAGRWWLADTPAGVLLQPWRHSGKAVTANCEPGERALVALRIARNGSVGAAAVVSCIPPVSHPFVTSVAPDGVGGLNIEVRAQSSSPESAQQDSHSCHCDCPARRVHVSVDAKASWHERETTTTTAHRLAAPSCAPGASQSRATPSPNDAAERLRQRYGIRALH